jgi:predicted transcriptional regulator
MSSPLARVLCNPTRARILEILTEDAASAAQLAERFDGDRKRITYHVMILAEAGCIRPVETKEERGAVERVWEPAPAR